jgi:uncharacterized protein YPO0396
MSEPAWSLPLNRAELIAHAEALAADLADSRLIAREQEDAHVAANMRCSNREALIDAANRRIRELEAQDEVHWKTRRTLLADLAQAQARLTELSDMKPATMRQALLLLTNGFKYSTEVVTIARDALAAETPATDKCVKCGVPLPPLEQWSMPACLICTSQADQASKP